MLGSTLALIVWMLRRALGVASERERIFNQTRVEIAKHSNPNPVPHSVNITYSPHTRTNAAPTQLADTAMAQPEEHPATAFRDILHHIQGGQFIMGIDEQGKPVMGDWMKMYSAGIGGLQGAGKSWTAAFILCQSHIQGAEIYCIDPHAHAEDSLYSRIHPLLTRPVATSPIEIEALVKDIDSEITERVDTGRKNPHIVVVVDEWSYLVYTQGVASLNNLLARISTAGRKHGVFALIVAHKWTVKEMGGNTRSLLSAFYLHRMRRDEARAMTNMPDIPKDILQLGDGQAYLLDQSGVLKRVSIPRMTTQDIVDVGQSRSVSAPGEPVPSEVRVLSSKEHRVLDMMEEGHSFSSIIKEVWGISGGQAYKEASEELRTILLGLVQR